MNDEEKKRRERGRREFGGCSFEQEFTRWGGRLQRLANKRV